MNITDRPRLFGLPAIVWRLLLAAAIVAVVMLRRADAAEAPCPAPAPEVKAPCVDSWIFMRGRYTHDPATGARVAQYAMKPPVEPLDDPRAVTSGYSRNRVVLRGADGSVDTYYRVTNFGNGRGGLDAEWERFHDAWRGSTVAGGQYQVNYPPFGYPGFATPWGGGWRGGGHDGGGQWQGPGGGGQWQGPDRWRGHGWQYGPGYGYGPDYGYGPGYGTPDPGRLDPDGADGWREQRPRTPDSEFFSHGLPPHERRPRQHHNRPGPPSQ